MELTELGKAVLYYGDISRRGYLTLSELYENWSEEDKGLGLTLVVITQGGDPGAAFRMARASRHHCGDFAVLVSDVCKSAGTLLCVGASKLVFGDLGELGPLDIQLAKSDERFGQMSGLHYGDALSTAGESAVSCFIEGFQRIENWTGLPRKSAAEAAARIAGAVYSPISERIDPATLGAHQRKMAIGMYYGNLLDQQSESLLPSAIERLTAGYPDHGFVIDRREARSLFKNVEAPSAGSVYEVLDGVVRGLVSSKRPVSGDAIVQEIDLGDIASLQSIRPGPFPPTRETEHEGRHDEAEARHESSDSTTAELSRYN